jgi:hypothetical protein
MPHKLRTRRLSWCKGRTSQGLSTRYRVSHPGWTRLPIILRCLVSLIALLASASVARSAADPSGDREGNVLAVSCTKFLSSLGVVTFVDQGYDASAYAGPLRYLGVHNIRDGERHLAATLKLHQETGVLVDLGGPDVKGMLVAARELAAAGALLSLEGPNEPNNSPVEYEGKRGGGAGDWLPVARLQHDLYKSVKQDPVLRRYPVFDVSEGGAETNNVGMQFLIIPKGEGTLMPDGTEFADYANLHNYVIGNCRRYQDNQAWQAADPTLNSCWDGMFVEYGRTWKRGYIGYSRENLQTLPRVTTETGWDSVADPGGENVQGKILVNTYLAQFIRGWRYTFIYELKDGEGGSGHQGLFRENWTPKPAANYIHNLTSILADGSPVLAPKELGFTMSGARETVHDLLLEKSDGTFDLVVWGEQVKSTSKVTIHFDKVHSDVRLYDVTQDPEPVQKLVNVTDVPLLVSDHALIVEIR